jgi:hypothetical protein
MQFWLVAILTLAFSQPSLASDQQGQTAAQNELLVCLYFGAFDYIGLKFSPKMAREALNRICADEKHRYDLRMNEPLHSAPKTLQYEDAEESVKLTEYSKSFSADGFEAIYNCL